MEPQIEWGNSSSKKAPKAFFLTFSEFQHGSNRSFCGVRGGDDGAIIIWESA